ncbi:hypothetical protein ABPG77_001163 [Micractinium sp. CCAP 211/92]
MKLGMEGEGMQVQTLSRGLSGMFRRKSKSGGSMAVLEADTLDAFSSGPLVAAGHPTPSPSRARPGILSGKPSGVAAGEVTAPHHQQQCLNAELATLRGQCRAQEQEIASLAAQLAAARAGEASALERLNLQHFKYELMVDLWAVRVLDNEELGAQQTQQQPQQATVR